MKKILFFLSVILLTSCSPSLYVNGTLIRKYNTTQNRYSSQKPYVGEPSKPRDYSSWGRFWFLRREK